MFKKKRLSLSMSKNEYSYIYRRKTIFELIRLSVAVIGIECSTSAINSYVSPILLEMGINYNKLTIVWALSPMIGFFLSPVMGSLSDRCRSGFGRRRPFILIFAVFNLIGLLLIPFGELLSNALQRHHEKHVEGGMNRKILLAEQTYDTIPVLVTIVGVVIADYTSDAVQNPTRAYLLDSCRTDDHVRGLSTFTVMAGLGGGFGYLLGSIDWKNKSIFGNLFHGNVFEGHVQMLFTITAVLFVVCICVSITTFKEVPLPLIESMDLNANDFMLDNSDTEMECQVQEIALITEEKPCYGTIGEYTNTSDKNEYPGLRNYLKSILYSPYSVRILCISNLFCWMANQSYALYFTDFVGIAVYGGDPGAVSGSPAKTLYEDGVKFGCWGMAVYSLSCTMYSLVVENLIKRFGLKRVYMFNILIDSVSLLLMAILRNKVAVILLSASCGILYSTIFTVPYILIAHYHTSNVFEINRFGDVISHKQHRGLGTDVSLIGSCAFVAQFTLSVLMTVITNFTASSTVVIVVGSILAIGGFLSARKVMYLDM